MLLKVDPLWPVAIVQSVLIIGLLRIAPEAVSQFGWQVMVICGLKCKSFLSNSFLPNRLRAHLRAKLCASEALISCHGILETNTEKGFLKSII
jgi:hypothetical protein